MPYNLLWEENPIGKVELRLYHKNKENYSTRCTRWTGVVLMFTVVTLAVVQLLNYGAFDEVSVSYIPYMDNLVLA